MPHPSGAGLRNLPILRYIMELDICCQQFGEYISVEDIFWYWKYHANPWEMNVSLRVPVCPSDAGLENIPILKYGIGYIYAYAYMHDFRK